MATLTAGATRILIVDDDVKLCCLLKDYLEPFGFEVSFAHAGPEGLSRALEPGCEAVILDVMLPGLPAGTFPVTQIPFVTPEHFSVLNIPLKRGRLFRKGDVGKPRYVVNETIVIAGVILALQVLVSAWPTARRAAGVTLNTALRWNNSQGR